MTQHQEVCGDADEVLLVLLLFQSLFTMALLDDLDVSLIANILSG